MIFTIGTGSERKIQTVHKVIQEISNLKNFKINTFNAQSGVSETPWDKETFIGARRRALDCKENIFSDYYIGMESGLVERYGHIYEEAWSCVISHKDNREYYGYSSGLKVPDFILQKMNAYQLPHYLIFAKINNHFNKEINSDTWGLYTDNLILREISLKESLRNALVQIFASNTSYYKKQI